MRCKLCNDAMDTDHPLSIYARNPATGRRAWMHFSCFREAVESLIGAPAASKEQYFFECGTYECRMADGIFDTLDEAKAAVQVYAFNQGLTDKPIEWVDSHRWSTVTIDGYELSIHKLAKGVIYAHDDLETYGRFEPDNFDGG